ncbi:MAG: helix-hairpin-helix domain-containing protein [Polyangiaceae bacterium]|nr:helix-hairpin-helix domain-containing protein [Polyangiaceae bacterium]
MTATNGTSIHRGPPDTPGVPTLTRYLSRTSVTEPGTVASGLFTRLASWRGSVWFPVVLRAAGIGVLLTTLGTVGAISIALGLPQANALPPSFAVARIAEPWLQPAKAAAPRTERFSPSTRTRASGPAPSARDSKTPVGSVPSAGVNGDSVAPAVPHSGSVPGSPPPATSVPEGGTTHPPGLTPDGKVILNTASPEQLTRLPGVGPKRAASIVALRERLGRFRRPTDLLRVRGIGPASLTKMQPYFVLDPPPEPPAGG